MTDTSIGINTETWQRLSARKRPGDSFDDVVNRVLDELEASETSTGSVDDLPRRFTIGEDDDPIALLAMHDDDDHDKVVGAAIGEFGRSLVETAPADALDPDRVVFDVGDVGPDEPQGDRPDHAADPPGEAIDVDVDTGPAPNDDPGPALDEDDEPMDPDVAAIDDVDTPADTPTRDEFVDVALAVLNHLRRSGPDTRSGFQTELHDAHSAGYANERTWWRRVAKPVLEAHPDVVAPDPGGSKWSIRE